MVPVARYIFGNRSIARTSEVLVPSGMRKWVRDKLLVRKAAKPVMDPEARAVLTDYYREDVRNLSAMLGRPLPWRNFA